MNFNGSYLFLGGAYSRGGSMRFFAFVALGAMVMQTGIAHADDIGSVRKKVPEFSATVPMNMFDIERCVIDTDNIGKPWVYRQPDRPNDVMLVWESSDFGNATVLEMHKDGNTTTMKFWGRNKAWRKAQPCIGRKESDIL
jgi:hypothetical protein